MLKGLKRLFLAKNTYTPERVAAKLGAGLCMKQNELEQESDDLRAQLYLLRLGRRIGPSVRSRFAGINSKIRRNARQIKFLEAIQK